MFEKDTNFCMTLRIENGKYRVSVNNDSCLRDMDFSSKYHYHVDYEIHYIQSGCWLFSADHKDYMCRENTLVILPPNMYHVTRMAEPGLKICVLYNTLKIDGQPLISATEEKVVSYRMPECEVFVDILNDFYLNPGSSNQQKLKSILTVMLLNIRDRALQKESRPKSRGSLHPSAINNILDYINNHCHEKISLQDVAGEMFLSTRQVTRIIKEETGKTFSDLLSQYRISRAKKLLRESDRPLETIAQAVGFLTYAGFWKAFYGQEQISPSDYRKQTKP